MKYSVLVILITLSISCSNTKKEKTYYPNGNLKYEIAINNGLYHGIYKAYYEDGSLLAEGNYLNNSKQGLFTQYHNTTNTFLKTETLWKNDTSYYQKNIGKNSHILSEGALSKNQKTGKWKYYNEEDNYLQEVKEFLIIKDSTYLNQNWLLNKKQDTLLQGNHYKMMSLDTLDFEKQRVYFFLKQPYFSYESSLVVLLPKDNDILKKDFSNENSIEWDTIHNLAQRYKNKGKYTNRNHDVIFDLDYLSTGKKTLKGILIEKQQLENTTSVYDFKTRKIYFDERIFIKKITN